MKTICLLFATASLVLGEEPANPQIDFETFKLTVAEVSSLREARRVSEEEFIRMAAERGTVVLDTRAREKYDQLHIKGAVHLTFSDLSEATLRKIIPTKTTRVLIYCDNNFKGEPQSFPGKIPAAALNIPTFIALHGHGYTNVYELAPLLDIENTKIRFGGQRASES